MSKTPTKVAATSTPPHRSTAWSTSRRLASASVASPWRANTESPSVAECLALGRVPFEHADPRPGGDERLDGGPADARAASRAHHHLAGEPHLARQTLLACQPSPGPPDPPGLPALTWPPDPPGLPDPAWPTCPSARPRSQEDGQVLGAQDGLVDRDVPAGQEPVVVHLVGGSGARRRTSVRSAAMKSAGRSSPRLRNSKR